VREWIAPAPPDFVLEAQPPAHAPPRCQEVQTAMAISLIPLSSTTKSPQIDVISYGTG
jgi:hypothetical protein